MSQGVLTPLQLQAGASLLNNQGIKTLPSALTTAISSYNSTTVISNFLNAVGFYNTQSYATASTLASLLSIGNSTCAALGDSIPTGYSNLSPVATSPWGFAGLVLQTGQNYLGNGDIGKFAQGFGAVEGYINTTNQFINSSVNAQTYLGPTFTTMDSLTTNQISDINTNLTGFGVDLANQGQLTDLSNLNEYGTPGALLQQIANVAGLQGGTLNSIQTALVAEGLTTKDIQTLISGQDSVTPSQYNLIQRLAYQGMQNVTGTDLQQILSILDVTTPNINTMADLLDQSKIFPNSYTTLQTPSPNGPIPIYGADDSVNMEVAENVENYIPSDTGCYELAKVIPPAQAVSNKAVQSALQQVAGIASTTLPRLADAIVGSTPNVWNPDTTYLADDVVANGSPIPTIYRAQQDVPVGTDITDTSYWLPTTLGGLNTMNGLPLIQAQTSAIPTATSSFYNNTIATGSGENGTITTCDVLGLATDHNDFASQLNTATTAINALQTAGSLNTLNAAYVAILSAVNDAAVITQIANANAAIAALSASPYYATLNTAWAYMANYLNKEKGYQIKAGVDYFNLQANEQASVMGFIQQLPQYGLQTGPCDAACFLNQIADTSIAGGQAIIGVMREAQNSQRLGATGLAQTPKPSPVPPVTPVPTVIPITDTSTTTTSTC
jgi:hypothetical protein